MNAEPHALRRKALKVIQMKAESVRAFATLLVALLLPLVLIAWETRFALIYRQNRAGLQLHVIFK